MSTRRGHEIILATARAEALAQAGSSLRDLIVLDTQLPDADGRAVLARLKLDPSTVVIPVVVWAGGREERQSERRIALELGAQDYVNMANAELLVRRLERLFARLSPTSQ